MYVGDGLGPRAVRRCTASILGDVVQFSMLISTNDLRLPVINEIDSLSCKK